MPDRPAESEPPHRDLARSSTRRLEAGTSVRLEVFAEDLDAFVDFYTRVLGFTLTTDQRTAATPYAAVARDTVRIGAADPGHRSTRAPAPYPTASRLSWRSTIWTPPTSG